MLHPGARQPRALAPMPPWLLPPPPPPPQAQRRRGHLNLLRSQGQTRSPSQSLRRSGSLVLPGFELLWHDPQEALRSVGPKLSGVLGSAQLLCCPGACLRLTFSSLYYCININIYRSASLKLIFIDDIASTSLVSSTSSSASTLSQGAPFSLIEGCPDGLQSFSLFISSRHFPVLLCSFWW